MSKDYSIRTYHVGRLEEYQFILRNPYKLHWRDLSTCWNLLSYIGELRINHKSDRSSTRNFTQNGSHIIGCQAEYIVSVAFDKQMNPYLNDGDNGVDFIDIAPEFPGSLDVKGVSSDTKHWPPILKVDLDKKLRSDWYALVCIDFDCRRGALVGIVPKIELLNGTIRDFGYGDRLTLDAKFVKKWYYKYIYNKMTDAGVYEVGFAGEAINLQKFIEEDQKSGRVVKYEDW